jgi:hypothetical protein
MNLHVHTFMPNLHRDFEFHTIRLIPRKIAESPTRFINHLGYEEVDLRDIIVVTYCRLLCRPWKKEKKVIFISRLEHRTRLYKIKFYFL